MTSNQIKTGTTVLKALEKAHTFGTFDTNACAVDCKLCIENAQEFYNHYQSIEKSLLKKVEKGTYNWVLSVKAFYNYINACLSNPLCYRLYSYSKLTVDTTTRWLMAEQFANEFLEVIN